MKKLSAGHLLLLALACGCGGYLWFFFARLFAFYGIPSPALAFCAAAACMLIGLIDPLPVKLRTVCMMYLGFYGIVTDLLGLAITAPVYITLHRSGALVAVLGALTLLYGYCHGKKKVRTYYRIEAPLSSPLRIALLSDIHRGKTVDEALLRGILARIKAEKPDLLCLAGDLCDDTTSPREMLRTAELLGSLPIPTFSVLGNHDLDSVHHPVQYTQEAYRCALSQNGVRLLEDEIADLGEYCLLGRRDRWSGNRADVSALPARTKPCIVLDHQPFAYREAASLGAFLQLSGHTHAFQVFPLSWLGRVIPGFYGLYRYQNVTLITSSGLGNRGHRLRSGCSAEYVIIDVIPSKGA